MSLKKKIDSGPKDKKYDIDLTYITSRGLWYYTSWKGEEKKSGGIATNIGVHFFDMLTWIFGEVQENIVHLHEHDRHVELAADGTLAFLYDEQDAGSLALPSTQNGPHACSARVG